MRSLLFFTFVLLSSVTLFSQTDITVSGYIYDSETKKPLAYVNIGFVEKAVGTVSDESGFFELTYKSSKIGVNTILQISSIGYQTKKLAASEFYKQLARSNKIYLQPQPYNLDEVLIGNEKRKELTVGSSKTKENSRGYWLNKEALGGEIATKINIKHKNSRLEDLRFQVVKNNSGSIKIRVNIYEEVNGMPGKNVLKANIFHTISKYFGEEIIDLKPYNIVVSDNIIVSIELIKVFGNYIDFEVATSRFKGRSYTRHLSLDAWKRYDGERMAFSLKTSYPDKKNSKKDLSRTLPNRITLYWDSSLSMKNRALESELELLSDYLKKARPSTVEVIKFTTMVSEPKVFPISRGKNEDLMDYLKDTQYDGATNYANILKQNDFKAETILVFTDGNAQFESLEQLIYVPAFYINTSSNANKELLQTQANYGEGHFIDLLKKTKKQALDFMLNEIEDETVYDVNSKVLNTIYGTVKSDSLIIQGAEIKVKNSYVQTISDVNGNYKIEASEDDILQVSALGMLPKDIMVSNQQNININLEPDGQLLEEVLVKAKAKKELISTPYGEKNADAVGFATSGITGDDINASYQTLDQLISKLPGVMVSGVGANRRYKFARNLGSSMLFEPLPIIVIDGIIYDQNDGLDYLPPIDLQTIESIQSLKSIISTNRYGSDGQFGAIVIKTQATSFGWIKPEEKKLSALAKGNDYIETEVKMFDGYKEPSKYVRQLNTATSFEQAKNIYYNQKRQMDVMSVGYAVESSEYFTKWNKDFAQTILTNIAEFAYNNPKALLTLAYKLEEGKKYDDAKFIYERIAELRPKQAQSYRNLALIYVKTKNYTKAMDLYKQMLSSSIEGIDFSGLQQVIANELSHLLAQHRNKVDYSDIPADYLSSKFKYDQRIIFEWNEAPAEFELQFVNPKKKFFRWSHTQLENQERMLEEVKQGYATEEYIIDDAEAGEWMINIESFTEETNSINPTYLKYTVYKNYGLPNETQEVKVVKLNDCKPKVTFDKFLNQ